MKRRKMSRKGSVAPVRERGLKLLILLLLFCKPPVAPVRERGLKSMPKQILEAQAWSLP